MQKNTTQQMSNQSYHIAVAKGDGIGSEIMDAVLHILQKANCPLTISLIEMGKEWYEKGHSTGMTPEAMKTVEDIGILLKGPMETPKGKGVKSINVTARKRWNAYANKRVFKTLPGVETLFSKANIPINLTIVRENIEDTYGGIEHMLTPDVALCRRFITKPGSLQVHRYAFEMATQQGLTQIYCGHKANIMKMTDGLFLDCFYEVAKSYPEIEAKDIIVDDLAMKLVTKPQSFQVVVLPNLQGDIISDLCAGLVGGLGFAPSANIGDYISIFEAVHGTAPDIAGKGLANPTALLMSALMMLRHLGLHPYAQYIENALHKTLQEGLHTIDVCAGKENYLNTQAFAEAIVERFDSTGVETQTTIACMKQRFDRPSTNRIMQTEPLVEWHICGVDFFIQSNKQPTEIATAFNSILSTDFKLIMISNRGTQVYPNGSIYTDCVDQYRIRIEVANEKKTHTQEDILQLAITVAKQFTICSLETLKSYNEQKMYSLAQGQ